MTELRNLAAAGADFVMSVYKSISKYLSQCIDKKDISSCLKRSSHLLLDDRVKKNSC